MRNAEEFSGRRSGLRRTLPAYRGPGPSAAARPAAGRIRYAHGGGLPRVGPFRTVPAGGRRADLWVLVCGGVAAAAAFAAAFVAAGGVASHPAAPGTTVPAVMSQACPSPAAAPTP